MISKLHEFISETKYIDPRRLALSSIFSFLFVCYSITMDERRSGIEFLTRAGEVPTPPGWQFNLLSDVLGVTSLVDELNNPRIGNATEGSLLGPFFTEDAPDRP